MREANDIETKLFEVIETLVEKYICNKDTGHEFICCITPDGVPWYWHRAKQAIEAFKCHRTLEADDEI